MSNILTMNEVPKAVWDEVRAAYPNYRISSDFGQWAPGLITLRCEYREYSPLLKEEYYFDPKTFEQAIARPDTHHYLKAWMVRGLEYKHIEIVDGMARWLEPIFYACMVLESGWVLAEKDL